MTDKQKANLMSQEPDGVYCQGCGERLYTSDDLSKIEYVKTKRGGQLVFSHSLCRKGVDEKNLLGKGVSHAKD